MALFSNWQNAPKVITAGRIVRYKSTPNNWDGAGTAQPKVLYWEVTRISTSSYKYIGLSKAAADACVAYLQDIYTRQYLRWTVTLIESSVPGVEPSPYINQLTDVECTASIAATPIAGDDWEVTVTENDSDTIISKDELKDADEIAQLFQLADARNMKVDNPSLTAISIAITSARWESRESKIRGTFTAYGIESWTSRNAKFEVWDVNEWVEVQGASSLSGEEGTFAISDQDDNATFRISYRLSNDDPWTSSGSYTTHDMPIPNMSIISAIQCELSELVSRASYYLDVYVHTDDIYNSSIDTPSAWGIRVGFMSTDYSAPQIQSITKIDENTFRITTNSVTFNTDWALGYQPTVSLTLYGKFVAQGSLLRYDFMSLPYLNVVDNGIIVDSGVTRRTLTVRAELSSDIASDLMENALTNLESTVDSVDYGIIQVGVPSLVTIVPASRSRSLGIQSSAGRYSLTSTFKYDSVFGDILMMSEYITAQNDSSKNLTSPTASMTMTEKLGVVVTGQENISAGFFRILYSFLDGYTPTYDYSKITLKKWNPNVGDIDCWDTWQTTPDGSSSGTLVARNTSNAFFKLFYDGRESQMFARGEGANAPKAIMIVSMRTELSSRIIVFHTYGIGSFSQSNVHVYQLDENNVITESQSAIVYGDMVNVTPTSGTKKIYLSYESGGGSIISNSVNV